MKPPTEPTMTRVTMDDGSTGAEVFTPTSEPCHWCGGIGSVWIDKSGVEYRVCTACRQGWEGPPPRPHSAETNPVLAQIVAQLSSRRRTP